MQPLRAQVPAKIASAIFSAVISTGKLVLAQGTTGNTEASTTRRPSTPRTRPAGSGIAVGAHAAGAGGVPYADGGFADERLQLVVVGQDVLESDALHDQGLDQVF